MDASLVTMPDDWQRMLAVVAHPDDLEYGAASAIASWTDAGKWVGYVIVTDGEAGIDGLPPTDAAPIRVQEQRTSARIVGVDDVTFLHLPDGALKYGFDLRRRLAARSDGIGPTCCSSATTTSPTRWARATWW